jgi:hypothetical protein
LLSSFYFYLKLFLNIEDFKMNFQKITLFFVLIVLNCTLFAQNDSLSFKVSHDTLFFDTEYSFTIDYNHENISSVVLWEWKLLYPDYEYLIDSGSNNSGTDQFTFTFNIDTIPSYLGDYISNMEIHKDIKTYWPTLYIRAITSNNKTYHLKSTITVLADTIPILYTNPDGIYISEGPSEMFLNSEVSYSSVFVDDDGGGIDIDYWSWKLCLLNDSLPYILVCDDSVAGHAVCSWDAIYDYIPQGFNWHKNEDRSIKGYAFVMVENKIDGKIFGYYKSVSFFETETGIKDFTQNDLMSGCCMLSQNYPNPFNPRTTINWRLAVGSHVELTIYNILGQKIETLISEYQKAGRHTVEWDASNMPGGIYYYQLRANNEYNESKKMVLLK